MTLDEIRELINLVAETKVAELEVQKGDDRVRIRLSIPAEHYKTAPIYHPVPMQSRRHQPGRSTAAIGVLVAGTARRETLLPPNDGTVLVKSPIVGTFYECPSPGAPPFVRLGENGAARQGALHHRIHEADERDRMRRPRASWKASWCMNGQPVEYGEALFAIRAV